MMKLDRAAVGRGDLPEDGRLLWDALGREATLDLIERLGGIRLHLPSCDKMLKAQHERLARRMLVEGATSEQVRRKTGLGLRRIAVLRAEGASMSREA